MDIFTPAGQSDQRLHYVVVDGTNELICIVDTPRNREVLDKFGITYEQREHTLPEWRLWTVQ